MLQIVMGLASIFVQVTIYRRLRIGRYIITCMRILAQGRKYEYFFYFCMLIYETNLQKQHQTSILKFHRLLIKNIVCVIFAYRACNYVTVVQPGCGDPRRSIASAFHYCIDVV